MGRQVQRFSAIADQKLMDLSLAGIAAVALAVAVRALMRLYGERLDHKERTGPLEQRAAIGASRRRAQAHLWTCGAIMATITLPLLFFGVDHPDLGWKIAALGLGIAAFDALAVVMAVRTYRDAREMRRAQRVPEAAPFI